MTSILSPQEIVYYRRLIYTSFSGMVSEKQALEAVSLWENYFSDSKVFSPVRFLRVCKEALGIPNELAKILVRQLTENLDKSPEMLRDDPFQGGEVPDPSVRISQIRNTSERNIQNIVDQRAKRSDPGFLPVPQMHRPKPKRSEQIVFEFMISTLLNGVWLERSELLSYIRGSALSMPSKRMLQLWSEASAPQLMVPELELNEMTRVLDVIYTWYCDMFGPGTTDQSFARAVAQAEQLPEASFFSPRQFL